MNKIFLTLFLVLVSIEISTVFGEFYEGGTAEDGYYEDHKTFESRPYFCIINNFDYGYNNNYETSNYLFNETIKSINEWNDAIKMYYLFDWVDFSIELVDGFRFMSDCNAYIYFIDGDAGNILGKAMQWGDIMLIYIYYENIDEITDIHYVIKHEIGHSLGLGHRSPSLSNLSIMTPDLESHKDYDEDWISLIDAYSVYKIYGKDGF